MIKYVIKNIREELYIKNEYFQKTSDITEAVLYDEKFKLTLCGYKWVEIEI